MAKQTLAASLAQFRDLSKQNIRHVLNEAVQDVIEGAQTPQKAISAGAESFEVGKIPVDSKTLINSLHLGTEKVEAGQIGTIEPGTIQTFSWQTPYAARIEYGFVGTDEAGRTYNQAGRFFVSTHAQRFSEFVEHHAKEVRK